MDDKTPTPSPGKEDVFVSQIGSKSALKMRTLRGGQQGIWFGLGMSGLIGWSVAVPTFLGGVLGTWWDNRHPGGHSWTLALLGAGLVMGCLNAWHWIQKEEASIHGPLGDKDD